MASDISLLKLKQSVSVNLRLVRAAQDQVEECIQPNLSRKLFTSTPSTSPVTSNLQSSYPRCPSAAPALSFHHRLSACHLSSAQRCECQSRSLVSGQYRCCYSRTHDSAHTVCRRWYRDRNGPDWCIRCSLQLRMRRRGSLRPEARRTRGETPWCMYVVQRGKRLRW